METVFFTPLQAVNRLYDLLTSTNSRIMTADLSSFEENENHLFIYEDTDVSRVQIYLKNKIIMGFIRFYNLECHLYYNLNGHTKIYDIGINYVKRSQQLTLSQRRFLVNHGFQIRQRCLVRDFI